MKVKPSLTNIPSSSGFTLIELLVCMIIIGIIGAIIIPRIGSGARSSNTPADRKAQAELNMRYYLEQFRTPYTNIACSGDDTGDEGYGDGYVSCTVGIPTQNPAAPVGLKAFECPYRQGENVNTTCKMSTIKD